MSRPARWNATELKSEIHEHPNADWNYGFTHVILYTEHVVELPSIMQLLMGTRGVEITDILADIHLSYN